MSKSMRGWFGEQWNQMRGNIKWEIVKVLLPLAVLLVGVCNVY